MTLNQFVEWRKILKEHSGEWVEWIHKSVGFTHCDTCLNLHQRYFKIPGVPTIPQHPKCHCYLRELDELILNAIAQAKCRLDKFSVYIFIKNIQKKRLFESWGYDITDSEWLQKEFERQAKNKYLLGNYKLGKLDRHGQRISIEIELLRKDKDVTATFISGWMVYPTGTIELTTPYGG